MRPFVREDSSYCVTPEQFPRRYSSLVRRRTFFFFLEWSNPLSSSCVRIGFLFQMSTSSNSTNTYVLLLKKVGWRELVHIQSSLILLRENPRDIFSPWREITPPVVTYRTSTIFLDTCHHCGLRRLLHSVCYEGRSGPSVWFQYLKKWSSSSRNHRVVVTVGTSVVSVTLS